MKYYKASFMGGGIHPIEVVEVERANASSVVIAGRKRAKFTAYDSYFETFEGAKQWLLKEAEIKRNVSARQLEADNQRYQRYSELKES